MNVFWKPNSKESFRICHLAFARHETISGIPKQRTLKKNEEEIYLPQFHYRFSGHADQKSLNTVDFEAKTVKQRFRLHLRPTESMIAFSSLHHYVPRHRSVPDTH